MQMRMPAVCCWIFIIRAGYFTADTDVIKAVQEREKAIWPWYSPLMKLQGKIGLV